jgi:predicted regulator of Ras-like GTPase activity (Roadblock/LC7/MglB family)
MEGVLAGVITSPGVTGGMIVDDTGRVLVKSVPAMYDDKQLSAIANILLEQQMGLDDAIGGTRMSELRFDLGRVIAKPVASRSLVMLCDHSVNLQMLTIAMNVAAKKMEKIPVAAADAFAPVTPPKQLTPPTSSESGWTFMPLPLDGGKPLLKVVLIEKTAGTYWESMEDHISVNRVTARSIWRHYNLRPSKKFTLVNPKTGQSSTIKVQIIEDDRDKVYDGVVLVTLAAAEHLGVVDGQQVKVEVPVGGGLFGWEGI